MGWRARQAESQVKGHQKRQYLGRVRSKPCTTCCSFCLQRPSTCPNATFLSQSYNQLPLLCLFHEPSLTDPAPTQLPGSGSLALTHNFILAHLPSIPGAQSLEECHVPRSLDLLPERPCRVCCGERQIHSQGLGLLPCPLLLWETAAQQRSLPDRISCVFFPLWLLDSQNHVCE